MGFKDGAPLLFGVLDGVQGLLVHCLLESQRGLPVFGLAALVLSVGL